MSTQNIDLGTGDVILRHFTDFLEQGRAALIVEYLEGSARGSEERPAITSDSKSEVAGGAVEAVVRPLVGAQSLWHYRSARARRSRLTDSLWIACESDPCKLPAFFRLEEIAISSANMTARGGAGAAAQNVLVAHELAVVFAQCARRRPITWIRRVGRCASIPKHRQHLVKAFIVFRGG